MRDKTIRIVKRKHVIQATNAKFSLKVSTQDGTLMELVDKKSGMNLWPEKTVGIRVHDELIDQTYSDLDGKVRVKSTRIVRGKDTQSIRMRRSFPGACFDTETVIEMGKDNFLWKVGFKKTRGPERSLKVTFVLAEPAERRLDPNVAGLQAWRVWAPAVGAPFNSGGASTPGTMVFSHGKAVDGCDEIPIPGIICYDENKDVGMTFLKPFEEVCPRVFFTLNQREGDVLIENRHIGLRNDHDPEVGLYVVVHEGDWRAGLGWMFRRYREYFVPQNKRIFDIEGCMHYGKMLSEKRVKEWAGKMDFSWQEIPYFRNALSWGPNLPTEEPWDAVWPDIPQIKIPGMTYQKANEYLAMLKRYGVAGLIYHNSGEFNQQIARKQYRESIITLRDGSIHEGWRNRDPTAPPEAKGVLLNPDPDKPYGKMVEEEVYRSIELFPDLAGFFIDQCCFPRFDYGADDGQTMVGNRRCAFTLGAYMKLHERIWKFLKLKNKVTFANGPWCPAIQKHMDGVMAEGTYEQLVYFTLAKPLILCGTDENAMKWCLKFGGYPHVAPLGRGYTTFHLNEEPLPESSEDCYRRYLPLVRFMRGKKWVLTAHALKFFGPMDGNIFETKDGNYVVTVMGLKRSFREDKDDAIQVQVRLKDGKQIKKAELLSVDTDKRAKVKLTRKGKDIFFSVSPYITAGVVHLQK